MSKGVRRGEGSKDYCMQGPDRKKKGKMGVVIRRALTGPEYGGGALMVGGWVFGCYGVVWF